MHPRLKAAVYVRCRTVAAAGLVGYRGKSAGRAVSRGRCRMLIWRRGSESNRRPRLCRPLHDHSATPPGVGAAATRTVMRPYKRKGRAGQGSPRETGAGKESRTPDLNLGKVALYQLSYSRVGRELYHRLRSAEAANRSCYRSGAHRSRCATRVTGPRPFPAPWRSRPRRIRCSSN
jgi:hypothetical protein